MTTLKELRAQYAPYDTLAAFDEGFEAYGKTWTNPYDGNLAFSNKQGVNAQAWDRGLECAMRSKRSAYYLEADREGRITWKILDNPSN